MANVGLRMGSWGHVSGLPSAWTKENQLADISIQLHSLCFLIHTHIQTKHFQSCLDHMYKELPPWSTRNVSALPLAGFLPSNQLLIWIYPYISNLKYLVFETHSVNIYQSSDVTMDQHANKCVLGHRHSRCSTL